MENFERFIIDLAKLVSINSEQTEKQQGAPFGKNVKTALDAFCEIAKSLGFCVKNHDGYIAEFAVGEGEEVGIIGHLDVVPAGDLDNWNTPPFTLTEKDGKYFGRGVDDDKGPLLLCLYALKSVVDSGVKFNRKIRFFAGTNEETGWGDIDYYNTVGAFPEYGFSPDGHFPLTYAEKGIFPTWFYFPKLKKFSNILGGSALNAVCDYATMTPDFTPNADDLANFNLTYENGVIVSRGKTAHGSTPKEGVNAILPLLQYAKFCGERVDSIINCLFLDSFGVFDMQNEQGCVTLSPNLIRQTEKGIEITCDVRAPYPITLCDLKNKFDCFAVDYEIIEKQPPVCAQKDGWFVKSLLSAYKQVTNDNTPPISMGGSTFARAFKQGCSFGIHFPNAPSVAHQPNEFVSKRHFITAYEIYRQAIINIVKR